AVFRVRSFLLTCTFYILSVCKVSSPASIYPTPSSPFSSTTPCSDLTTGNFVARQIPISYLWTCLDLNVSRETRATFFNTTSTLSAQ
ncbi:hypothetical protein CPB85DRAFT_1284785, partial [Mucidula mucida]